jgi:membrane-bound lytic murein transglycosylase B
MIDRWRIATLARVTAAGLALTGCAGGSSLDSYATTGHGPGRVAAYAPAGTDDWSGVSGSSGHPEMQADAIRAAAANFKDCLERLWPLAARRGVSRASFDTYTAGLTPDLKLMDLMDAQPEFTKSPWDYVDLLVTDKRIARGREILAEYRATFDAVERAYGVDRYVIAAIWGIESNYSTSIGERSVLRSTATLACVGRRQDYFRDEFLSALEILHRGDLTPDELKGSWAGAFGPTQFMPSSYKRFAVDFDGDGRRDVVASVPDLIASTANNLKRDRWAVGQPWGYEVVLPQGFDYHLADGARMMTLREWERLGVTRPGNQPLPQSAARASLSLPGGARGPAFLMLDNFRAILRYNPAEAYALAIGHLADRLRGGAPFVQPWPRDERVLTSAERYELQELLITRGYDIGGSPDGRISGRTRNALRAFQSANGLVPDGFAGGAALDSLRGTSAASAPRR